MTISRRDFLNGAALTIAAGLTPAAQIAAQPALYPPALTGLRGQHPGSFETAHALALEGKTFALDGLPVEERYDLVVVGGGISGLSAAWFYRRAKPDAKILIIDNHDDFGGHAKRNEFMLDGRLLIGYGGSESMQSPKTLYSNVANDLLRALGVQVRRFETAFDRSFYESLGLSRGVFFGREAFGRDALVTGDPAGFEGEPEARRLSKSKPIAAFIAGFPISEAGKAQVLALYDRTRDPMPGKTSAEKLALLKSTSYRDYLMKFCGCGAEAADCFQGRPLGFYGLGADSVAASDARDLGYPGFDGLGIAAAKPAEYKEPYIYHFPDGNASLARLLVRALIPGIAPGRTMDDVVLAPFDYSRLDNSAQNVRIRLNAMCIHVRNTRGAVSLAYVRDNGIHRVEAAHAVLAGFHMAIPYIMPELPAQQRAALAKNVKTPLVYTNVLVRNWESWIKLGVHDISAPMSFHSRVKLDYPVSLGGYQHPRVPADPMVLHMQHVPGAQNQGLDARAQFRAGRGQILTMTFADFEERIRDDLDRMLGSGGFSAARDIAAITVNRWPHGYSYVASSLFDAEDYDDTVLEVARQKAGRVAIANTDAGGDAYAHLAIDHAARAVQELLG